MPVVIFIVLLDLGKKSSFVHTEKGSGALKKRFLTPLYILNWD
jgi:hypothetical protein